MALEKILVPQLGESVTEATIAKWHKNPGDFVKKDEIILELETDKITLEVSAQSDGKLSSIISKQGDTVEVGTVVGEIEPGNVPASGAVATPVAPVAEKPAAQVAMPEVSQDKNHPSPAAKVILDTNNISQENVVGSGKDGRITKNDAIVAMSAVPTAMITQQSERRVKMSRLRQTIAKRLKDVQNTAAILTTFNEIDMSEVMNLRKIYQDEFVKQHGIKLGFMSFFVKAVVAALKTFPAVNAEIDGDSIIYKDFCDIGVAVGTDNGLVVPIVRGAENLSFAQIEQGITELGKKARENKLSMQDMTGGTFTITNGGTYGSLLSTPIINPPQSGILGMHNIVQRPIGLPNGEIALRPMMYVALSYDHRIIDGKEAVQFLVMVKNLIESPSKMLLF